MMGRLMIAIVLACLLAGCGKAGRLEAKLTGYSERCIDGVVYLQFTSGATVKYNTDGTVTTCPS
jgi:hypothetical protein